jgi:hypothetical protein
MGDGGASGVIDRRGVKYAYSVIGPFMIILDALIAPVYDPVPSPVQRVNANPELGVVQIGTIVPASSQLELGAAEPAVAGLGIILRRNCRLKLAVYVTGFFGAVIV